MSATVLRVHAVALLAVLLGVPLSAAGDGPQDLRTAAARGEQAEVARLVVAGTDVNARDDQGFTALHLAVHARHVAVAQYLIEHGADINAVSFGGLTPMHQAVDGATARMLLAHHADIKVSVAPIGTALHVAILRGADDVANVLVDGGADPAAPGPYGSTPLHYAAGRGDTALVARLLDAGAAVDVRNELGFTALHWAAGEGRGPVAKLLLERGADVNARSQPGTTPVDTAQRKLQPGMVQFLKRHGGLSGRDDAA